MLWTSVAKLYLLVSIICMCRCNISVIIPSLWRSHRFLFQLVVSSPSLCLLALQSRRFSRILTSEKDEMCKKSALSLTEEKKETKQQRMHSDYFSAVIWK